MAPLAVDYQRQTATSAQLQLYITILSSGMYNTIISFQLELPYHVSCLTIKKHGIAL